MDVNYDPKNDALRWLGYFDLLGTSELIRTGKIFELFHAYQVVLEQLNRWEKRHANVSHAWFSDTFLVFADDDSFESFAAIDRVCRWLMFALVQRKIPVRGSLACGQFYSDQPNSLFLGSALLEAYEFGENQDWIGFILCPSSSARLAELELPVEERLNYVNYDVPFKKMTDGLSNYLAACILGNWAMLRGEQNVLIAKLNEMMNEQHDDRIRKKYERTILFIEKNQRILVGDVDKR